MSRDCHGVDHISHGLVQIHTYVFHIDIEVFMKAAQRYTIYQLTTKKLSFLTKFGGRNWKTVAYTFCCVFHCIELILLMLV